MGLYLKRFYGTILTLILLIVVISFAMNPESNGMTKEERIARMLQDGFYTLDEIPMDYVSIIPAKYRLGLSDAAMVADQERSLSNLINHLNVNGIYDPKLIPVMGSYRAKREIDKPIRFQISIWLSECNHKNNL